jgi:hypothetical protein
VNTDAGPTISRRQLLAGLIFAPAAAVTQSMPVPPTVEDVLQRIGARGGISVPARNQPQTWHVAADRAIDNGLLLRAYLAEADDIASDEYTLTREGFAAVGKPLPLQTFNALVECTSCHEHFSSPCAPACPHA